jgi:hypothetical protein
MSRSAGRSHAWLPKQMGEPGEPFLPKVGEVYRINTIITTIGHDRAAARPAVVIAIPSDPVSRFPIQVAARTSQRVPGVLHPADRSLNLDLDGVFSDLRSVELGLWRPEYVVRLGVLPDPYLSEVLRRFT